jgi:hypothetical protein
MQPFSWLTELFSRLGVIVAVSAIKCKLAEIELNCFGIVDVLDTIGSGDDEGEVGAEDTDEEEEDG